MSNEDRLQKWRQSRLQQAELAKEQRLKRASKRSEGKVSAREEAHEQENIRAAAIADAMVPTLQDAEDWRIQTGWERETEARKTLFRQLLFFGIPVLISTLYAIFFLTPLYEAKTTFSINSAATTSQGGGPNGGLVGLFSGASLSDGFKVQEYLQSKEAMNAVESRTGYLNSFGPGRSDLFTRPINMTAFGIDRHDFYQKRIKPTIDLRSGLLTLYVQGKSPEQAVAVSEALLDQVKLKVLELTANIDSDQLDALEQSVKIAQANLEQASAAILSAQGNQGSVSPVEINAGIYQLISSLELELAEAERERTGLLEANLTRSPLLPGLNSKIENLTTQIQRQRQRLQGTQAQSSIAVTQTRLENLIAQRDIAQQNLQFALTTYEEARQRVLANRRYLTVLAGPERPSVSVFKRSALYIAGLASILSLLAFVGFMIFSALRLSQRGYS